MTKKNIFLASIFASVVGFGAVLCGNRLIVGFSNNTTIKGLKPATKDFYVESNAIKVMGNELRAGNDAYQNSDYILAVDHYKRAMDADPGSRTFIGLKLIDTYEKMGEYSQALHTLDLIIDKNSSEYGQKKAVEIRKRLELALNKTIH